MEDIHTKNMAAGIKNIFESSKYSDLTIWCSGKEFKVHRNILCPRSPFFAASCDGEFQVCHYDLLANTIANNSRKQKRGRLPWTMMMWTLSGGCYRISILSIMKI